MVETNHNIVNQREALN